MNITTMKIAMTIMENVAGVIFSRNMSDSFLTWFFTMP